VGSTTTSPRRDDFDSAPVNNGIANSLLPQQIRLDAFDSQNVTTMPMVQISNRMVVENLTGKLNCGRATQTIY
jgi:hypothetical protein